MSRVTPEARAWIEADITTRQIAVLLLVRDQPLHVSEVASLLGVAPPTVSTMLIRMEDHGWIQRTPDVSYRNDRRATYVQITEAGHAILMRLRIR